MRQEEQTKRRIISKLMREAATIFSRGQGHDMSPALPKMRAAVRLATELEDKTPLVICESNYASMAAVLGDQQEASEHIEHAIRVSMTGEMPTTIRNFVITKFVEIAILLHEDRERALTYARALLQSAVEEEQNYQQYLAAAFNLAVVCHELFRNDQWAVALFSFIDNDDVPHDHPIPKQARLLSDKIAIEQEGEDPDVWLSEVEANRDFLLEEATGGFLPKYAPGPPDDSVWDEPGPEFTDEF